MKILFVYPMKIYKKGSKYYAPSFTNGILKRYTSIFENGATLDWFCRIINDNNSNINGLNEIDIDTYHLYDSYQTNLKKIIQEYDFVISRVPDLLYAYKCTKYCIKFDIPYVLEVVGCSFDALWFHSLKGKIAAPISYVLHRYIIRKSLNVVYVTKNFLQKRYPNEKNNIFISDVELFKSVSYRYQHQDKIILATIGSVDVKYKDQETVVKAVHYLIKNGYDVEYRLIGPGNKMHLTELASNLGIRDKIIFFGPVAHENIPKFLEGVTYYVQPSLTEGLPRSILEVESLGIPVISTRVGGMVEIVKDNLLFEKKDHYNLSKIIQENLSNLNELSKYSLSVSREYDEDIMRNKLNTFYKNAYMKEDE